MKEIAVIIPAFRAQHLHRTLSSLALQTEKNFAVYVGDDASPDDLKGIAGEFEDTLDIYYTRFEENFGIARQSAHLERCLGLTQGEPLVCFLSDDNEWTPDVARRVGKAARRHQEINVFHLNTDYIDTASEPAGKGRRYCRKMRPERLFRRIFVKQAPAPFSSFFFRREALEKAMFQIRDVSRSPLTLVFACMTPKGRLLTVRYARLRKRIYSADSVTNPATMLEKSQQMQSFFGWSEYFFEDGYPLSPRDRVELFAAHAAGMYPSRTEAEILEKFLTFRVFEREFSKNRGKRILHRSLKR